MCMFSGGVDVPVKVRDVGDGVFKCDYCPVKPGKYHVNITWGDQPIPRRWELVVN